MIFMLLNCHPVIHARLEPYARECEDVEARPRHVGGDHRGEVGHGAPEAAGGLVVPPQADHDAGDDRAEGTVYPLRAEVLSKE